MGTSGNGTTAPVNNLHKRKEQLTAWESSDANKASSQVKNPQRVKFKPEVAFLAACNATDLCEIERFLSDNVDINTSNIDGLTALHQACIDNKLDLIKFLIDHGADIHARDSEGWTPLHATALGGHIEVAKYLLKEGAKVGLANNDGDLPIDVAEAWEMKQLLKESMARIDENRARNAEALAMQKDARAWLKEGRYRCVRDPRSHASPLHVAAAKGYSIVLTTLLQCPGVDINDRDSDGWTPLHAAAHWGQEGACRVLAAHGADMSAVTHANQTVLDIAEEDLVEQLKDLQAKQADLMKQESVKQPYIASVKEDDSPKPYTSRRSSVTRVTQSERHDLTSKSAELEKHPESLPRPVHQQTPLSQQQDQQQDDSSSSSSSSGVATSADEASSSGAAASSARPPVSPRVRAPILERQPALSPPKEEEPPPPPPPSSAGHKTEPPTSVVEVPAGGAAAAAAAAAEEEDPDLKGSNPTLGSSRAAERRRLRAAATAAAAATEAEQPQPEPQQEPKQEPEVEPVKASGQGQAEVMSDSASSDKIESDERRSKSPQPPQPSPPQQPLQHVTQEDTKRDGDTSRRPADFYSPGMTPSTSVKDVDEPPSVPSISVCEDTILRRMESLQESSSNPGVQIRRRQLVNCGVGPQRASSHAGSATLRVTSAIVTGSNCDDIVSGPCMLFAKPAGGDTLKQPQQLPKDAEEEAAPSAPAVDSPQPATPETGQQPTQQQQQQKQEEEDQEQQDTLQTSVGLAPPPTSGSSTSSSSARVVSAIMEKEKVEESETERRRISRRNRATKRATQGVAQEVVEQARKLVEERRTAASAVTDGSQATDAADSGAESSTAAAAVERQLSLAKTGEDGDNFGDGKSSRRTPAESGGLDAAGAGGGRYSSTRLARRQPTVGVSGSGEYDSGRGGSTQGISSSSDSPGIGRSRPGSYHGSAAAAAAAASDGTGSALDYKRLYEKEKANSDRLGAENTRLRDENEQLKRQSSEQRQVDKRLSEYEAQNRSLEQVMRENEKLKAENRALARVVARLSRQ